MLPYLLAVAGGFIIGNKFSDGGKINQEIKCFNCGWKWNTKDSKESDKYVCHKCGFDNTLYYKKII
jgi:hypothetical protein